MQNPTYNFPTEPVADVLDRLKVIPDLATEAFLGWNHPNPTEKAGRQAPGAPDTRCPTDLAVLDALRPDPNGKSASLRGTLAMAVRAVWEDARVEGSTVPDLAEDPTIAGECGWLVATAVFWRSDRWLTEYVTDQVGHVYGELLRLVRMPRPQRLVCPRCDFPVHPQADGAYYQCEAGHIIDHHAEIRRMGQLQEMTLAEIAEHTGVPEKTLHRWAKAGWVTPVTDKRRGRLFVLGDVQLVAERVRAGGKVGA